MEYKRLISGLKAMFIRAYRVVSLVDETVVVTATQLIRTQNDHVPHFSRDYLFIGLVSELPANPENAPHDCICVNDALLPAAYETSELNLNLVLVDVVADTPTERLLLLQNHVAFVLADDVKYYLGYEHLVTATQYGDTLECVMKRCFKIVVNPLLLLREDGQVLASAGGELFSDPALRAALESGVLPASDLDVLRKENVLPQMEDYYAGCNGPFDINWHNKCLVFPVRVQGLTAALLVVQCTNSPLRYPLLRLKEQMQQLISRTLEYLCGTDTKALLDNLLFAELLYNTHEFDELLCRRLQQLHWKAEAGMQLMVCVSDDGSELDTSRCHRLSAQIPGCHWCVRAGQLMLLCYPDERSVDAFLAGEHLRAGLSWPFEDLLQLSSAREQAEAALRMGSGTLTAYGNVFATHIHTVPADQLHRFLHPAVQLLERQDPILLETLALYLSGTDQVMDLAEQMHIHRSTLFYRLSRIRTLCGITLDNGEEKMNLLLSIRLLSVAQGPTAVPAG